MQKQIGAGALFNSDNTHRYYLWRIWNLQKPLVAFIGLNPSTANGSKNDNTIKKVIKVADYNGYGGLYMLNLFPLVSTDPTYLLNRTYSMAENDEWIDKITKECKDVVFCWGSFKEAKTRAKQIIKRFPGALCFEVLKDGSPKHPLFCKDKTFLIPYKI